MARLAVKAIVSGIAGGISGARFGPWGAVVGAVSGVSSTLLSARRGDEGAADALSERQHVIRAAEPPAWWVVGRARVSGALFHYSERTFAKGDTVFADGEAVEVGRAGKVAHLGLILSHGQLSSVDAVLVNGVEMPMRRRGVPGTHGDVLYADIDLLDSRAAEIGGRLEDMGYDIGTVTPSQASMFSCIGVDLAGEYRDVQNSKRNMGSIWSHPFAQFNPFETGDDRAKKRSCIQVYTDYGGASVSAADWAADRAGADDFAFHGTGSQVQGLAWVFVELFSFEDGPEWNGRLPDLHFVCKSGLLGGGYTENPAEVARWYLTERCGVNLGAIDGLDQAVPRCAERLLIEEIDITVPSDGPVGRDAVIDRLYPDMPPKGNILRGVLAEWNRQYAGPGNAEPRYQCHGIITADMMDDSTRLLEELGRAMGGWIIPVGDTYRFVAGEPTLPVLTVREDDVVEGLVRWLPGTRYEDRANSVRASLVQDARDAFTPSELDPLTADSVTASDLLESDVGPLPFQASVIAGDRLLGMHLTRLSETLLTAQFNLNPGEGFAHFRLRAGDRIRMEMETEGVSATFLVQSVDSSIESGVVSVVAKEDPDSLYSDFGRAPLSCKSGQVANDTTPAHLVVSGSGSWRRVSVNDPDVPVIDPPPVEGEGPGEGERDERSPRSLPSSSSDYLRTERNEQYETGPYNPELSNPRTLVMRTSGGTVVPQEGPTGEFKTGFVFDMAMTAGVRVRSIAFTVYLGAGPEYTYTSDLTEEEIRSGAVPRTLVEPDGDDRPPKVFDPDERDLLSVEIQGFDAFGGEGLGGPLARIVVGGRDVLALADLTDYARESLLPKPGWSVRYNEEGSIHPYPHLVVLPEGTPDEAVDLDGYEELTLAGVPEPRGSE